MDNNNPIIQPSAEGNKNIILLIVGLVAVILLIGGIYWYLTAQQTPTPQPTPRPATTETNLKGELDSIDVQTTDSDFTPVDSDLQSL